MAVNSPTNLARLALKSAEMELGEVADTANYLVNVTNRVTMHHSITELKLERPPEAARKYLFFRPRLVRKALVEVRHRQQANPEEFLKQHAPAYLSGAISSSTYDKHFEPLAYRQRTAKVLDKVETRSCRRCDGKGNYTETRTEGTQITCQSCAGTGVRLVTEYINSPGRTDHGTPVSNFKICACCVGSGYLSGPTRTWTETVSCERCNGTGQLEKKYYRKEGVFYADVVRSEFRREVKFTWPDEVQRLVNHSLVDEEDLFEFCQKSDETYKIVGGDALINVNVNLAVKRHNGMSGMISMLEVQGQDVLFSDAPILDQYLKRLTSELARLPWKEVQDRGKSDAFVNAMINSALGNKKPETLVPELGFMASRGRVGALLRQLRWIERRRRVIGWTIAISLSVLAAYALIQ